MAKTQATRIQLKGEGVFEEGRAAAAVRPGDLVDLDIAGKVKKHPTAGAPSENSFALEDALQGKGINDNYATGDLVAYSIQRPGDVVLAWLAAGQVATPASYLTSNGNGALKVAGGTDIRIGRALESVNASDSGAVFDERIRVRII